MNLISFFKARNSLSPVKTNEENIFEKNDNNPFFNFLKKNEQN
jgi:hypothetical protein